MKAIQRVFNWLSSLKVAIVLLLLIAFSSAIGTAIPQGERADTYIGIFKDDPWLGLINGEVLLKLELDHVYTSYWFIILLFWLSLALIICSFRRQLPSLKSSIQWIDYQKPYQINKLAISQTVTVRNPLKVIDYLAKNLINKGWQVEKKNDRLAARKGVIGKIGPLLVHIGLILLMLGATVGAFQGKKVEKFIAPGRSIDLLSKNGEKQISLKLNNFKIKRGPNGQPEQFISEVNLNNLSLYEELNKEISVNHPLRYKGLTIYQADWSLAAITIQINNSPKLRMPLKSINDLGDQVWGVLIPGIENKSSPLLLTLSSEKGPARIFNTEGDFIGLIRPGGEAKQISEDLIRIFDVIPASGILIKQDPGIPIVYSGFAITLLGSILSIISTKKLWAIYELQENKLHVGGFSNRNFSGLSKEFPNIIESLSKNN